MIEIFKEILPLAVRVAPMIAGSLGSPIAGVVTELLAQAFGADARNPEDLVNKINQNPDAESILKTLENQHGAYFKAITNIKLPQNLKLSLELTWPEQVG